ncbi:hypothetical protein MHPYR_10201 [uncultured Mycobacterium sp.]|uniref:Uncharacterized protein n=1 Tax=uncultured Mycobacterium sp. TaxID=171292 RepID=A0A1Y5NW04_9MYCO|nr:hypothetical protein MHPYR_10201 [uncultured Mycobacterium sp.]
MVRAPERARFAVGPAVVSTSHLVRLVEGTIGGPIRWLLSPIRFHRRNTGHRGMDRTGIPPAGGSGTRGAASCAAIRS